MSLSRLAVLPVLMLSAPAFAGQCEDNFKKSGNPFSGNQYYSSVTVPNLSMKDAMGQIRGIAIAEKLDVITEDKSGGTMLVEQRGTNWARPVPAVINFSQEGTAAVIEITIKPEKGVFSKLEVMKDFTCKVLGQVKSGKEGKAAAAKGAQQQNNTDTTVRDVFSFSNDIANEAHKNPIAVNARHKGRSYTLKGKINHMMEDGDEYNIGFEIIPMHERALSPLPGMADFAVDVRCLFRQDQLANVLSFRNGQRVSFTGTFLRYDHGRKVVWLQDCKPTAKKK